MHVILATKHESGGKRRGQSNPVCKEQVQQALLEQKELEWDVEYGHRLRRVDQTDFLSVNIEDI